jgi:hypothetical protein
MRSTHFNLLFRLEHAGYVGPFVAHVNINIFSFLTESNGETMKNLLTDHGIEMQDFDADS